MSKVETVHHSFYASGSAFVVKKWRVTKMFCLIKVDLESNKKDIESNKKRLCYMKKDSVKYKSNK